MDFLCNAVNVVTHFSSLFFVTFSLSVLRNLTCLGFFLAGFFCLFPGYLLSAAFFM